MEAATAKLRQERPRIVIEPRQEGTDRRLREFWRTKGLVIFFGRRILEKTYMRSKLGILWLPLRPLLTVASRALVFGGLLGAPSGDVPYFLFFLVGMAAWAIFDRSLFWAARSIELNVGLAKKLYFSRLVLPAAAFLPAALDLLIYMILVALTLAYFVIFDGAFYLNVSLQLLDGLAGFLIIGAMAAGIGLYISVLGAFTRDVRFSIGYVLGFIFFLSPVIYPLEAIPKRFETLASLNPLSAPIELVRLGFLGDGEVHTAALLYSIGFAVLTCILGFRFFSKWEAGSIDSL